MYRMEVKDFGRIYMQNSLLSLCGFLLSRIFPFTFFCVCVWLHWVFLAVHGLSLVVASGATLHCGARASHCGGFSCCRARPLGVRASVVAACGLSRCGTRALESASFSNCSAWAQQLWCTALVAPQHVGSSWTRDQTRVPCIGRQILNHSATREVPPLYFSAILTVPKTSFFA